MESNNIIIRREVPADYHIVENLVRESFWNVYQPGCQEHYVLHCYRDCPDFVPELDLVLLYNGKIIAQIMYVHSYITCKDGTQLPILTFGPISVLPPYKRHGFGKMLLDYSMQKATEYGAGAIAITGNISFYIHSGFVLAKDKNIHYYDDPEADYFLIKELVPGFLDGIHGTYRDPEGYFVCQKNPAGFAEFEATFPYKDKLRLPGQLF